MLNLKKFIVLLVFLPFIASCQPGGGKMVFFKEFSGKTAVAENSQAKAPAAKIAGVNSALLGNLVLGNLALKPAASSLDRADLNYYHQASQNSLENTKDGYKSSWSNPDNGHFGTITPIKTYQEAGGYCRQYRQTVNTGYKEDESYDHACRQPDGMWKIKN